MSKYFVCHFQSLQNNGPKLVIESARVEDTGKYICMVGNYIGIKSVDVWVTVKQTTTTSTTTTTTKPPTTTTASTTTTTPAPTTTTTTTTVATTSTPQPTTTTSMEVIYIGPMVPDTTDDEDVYEGNVLFTTIRFFGLFIEIVFEMP